MEVIETTSSLGCVATDPGSGDASKDCTDTVEVAVRLGEDKGEPEAAFWALVMNTD